jgi:hypothetical protein
VEKDAILFRKKEGAVAEETTAVEPAAMDEELGYIPPAPLLREAGQ